MENGQHAGGFVVGDVVKERLCFPAEGYDAIYSQSGEMLRKGRLANVHSIAQRRNAELAGGREMAQDEKALLVAKGAQQI